LFHSELDEALYCVQMGEYLGQLDFFMITKVLSTYLFRKRGGSAKDSKARVSTFSMTRFATTDEIGDTLLFQILVCRVFHEK